MMREVGQTSLRVIKLELKVGVAFTNFLTSSMAGELAGSRPFILFFQVSCPFSCSVESRGW